MLGVLLVGCFNNKSDEGRLSVVCTTGMITDVVQFIAQDKLEVKGLMGPGVDPHLYRASEGDISVLNQAHLILYNGLYLESKFMDIFSHLSEKKPVVAVTSTISKDRLLSPPDFDGLYDPHIWFDLELWKEVVAVITSELSKLMPSEKAFFESNKTHYLEQLTLLQRDTLAQVSQLSVDQRILVTAHDAFNYFGRAYDFQVTALQGVSTESEAGIADVQALVSFIVDQKIPAIFVESSISERHIRAVQESVQSKGWNVSIGGMLYSDALGSADSEAGTYLGMMAYNVNEIVTALLINKGDEKNEK